MFWGVSCDFRRAPISPSQLGLLWHCRGAPGRSRSAPRTALDALRAATVAAPEAHSGQRGTAVRHAWATLLSKLMFFRNIFAFWQKSFDFCVVFEYLFVVIGSRPFLHHNGVCSGAAGPPLRRSRTRSGPPRSAPGRGSDAFWDVLLEKGPNGILIGGQMRGAHLRSC